MLDILMLPFILDFQGVLLGKYAMILAFMLMPKKKIKILLIIVGVASGNKLGDLEEDCSPHCQYMLHLRVHLINIS